MAPSEGNEVRILLSTRPATPLRALPLLIAIFGFALAPLSWGQEEPPPLPTPSRDSVVDAIAQIEAAESGDPAAREVALTAYRAALNSLTSAEAHDQGAISHRQELEAAPRRAELLREELAAPLPRAESEENGPRTLAQLEDALRQASAEWTAAKEDAEKLQAEGPTREIRRADIATRLAQIQQETSQLEEQLGTAAEIGSGDVIARAPVVQSLARRREIAAEAEILRAELDSLNGRRELLPLRRERALRRAGIAERRVSALDAELAAKRVVEAANVAAEAEVSRRTTAARYPVLETLALEIEALAASRGGDDGSLSRISRAQTARDKTLGSLSELKIGFEFALRRVLEFGLTPAGETLRLELGKLPFPGVVRRDLRNIRRELNEVQYELFIEKEKWATEKDIQARGNALASELGLAEDRAEDVEIRQRGGQLLRQGLAHRQEIVNDLTLLTESLADHLAALAVYERVTDAYRQYIEERVLWVPNATSGFAERTRDGPDALGWLFDGAEWRAALERLASLLRDRWITALLFVLLLLALVTVRPRLLRQSEGFSERVRHHSTDSLRHTWGELALTVLLALPVPFGLFVIGRVMLSIPVEQEPLATSTGVDHAVATGVALHDSSGLLLVLLLVVYATRPKRLAESHFRWPAKAVASLGRNLALCSWVLVPAYAVWTLFDAQPKREYADSIGLLSFEVAVLAVTMFVWRTLRPHGPVLGDYIRRNPASLVSRLRLAWFLPLLALPPGLGIAAAAGYTYTARELGMRLQWSIGFVLLVLLVNAILLRWLFVARRRLAFQQIRIRRRASEESAETAGEVEPAEDEVDIPALDAQTKQLFRAGLSVALGLGLYLFWVDILPALHVLERVKIYPALQWVPSDQGESRTLRDYLAVVKKEGPRMTAPPRPETGGTADAKGEDSARGTEAPSAPSIGPAGVFPDTSSSSAESSPHPSADAVDLSDLLLTLLLLFFTGIATRNVPGLLEIAVLARLPLDRGSRYAIRSIARYLILIIGTTIAFGAVGIGWGNIQWLAAAFTFGLAFGLQEIFANFVSGLIILLERPVRVGDIVTVAGIEGRVLRLQMRSTTIQDYDRRELLIPNKEFITGSLINWTLSDPISRLTITVGIAYGSDVDKARHLLLDVAERTAQVLEDPAPTVLFHRFGESSLDFELRVFIPHRDVWAPVTDAIHGAIDAEFRREGIEIAFPQRDLHVRSAPGLRDLPRPTSPAEPRRPENA